MRSAYNSDMTKAQLLNTLIKDIIKVSDGIADDTSIIMYKMLCDMNGVKCSFDDPNFMLFLVGKSRQHYRDDTMLHEHLLAGVKQFKLLNPLKNKVHNDALEEIMSADMIGQNHDFYQDYQDYVIRNFPTSPVGQKMVSFARASGLTSVSLAELIECKHKIEQLPKAQRAISPYGKKKRQNHEEIGQDLIEAGNH